MSIFTLTPTVDPTQEFIEIAYDFSNPLDIVREGISNAFDAGATQMDISFFTITEYGEKVLITVLRDNGNGMDRKGLQSFFDLGNSLRRDDDEAIGEKGHGTKVYLNSEKIRICTVKDGTKLTAEMLSPKKKLHNRELPEVTVSDESCEDANGTEITIHGYNGNRRSEFTHEHLKDYIQWATKVGSVENEFGITKNSSFMLTLKGVDRKESEPIMFGHFFPKNSKSVSALFDEHLVQAPKWYCKKIIRSGNLENFPEIKYDAVFCVEGNSVKYNYNPMIRRSGYTAPSGSYTVQERYGIWMCKDFIPIQRKNEWITSRGSEYTRFHAFVNCQDLRLTANRGSIDNTPSEIMDDLRKAIGKIYNDIIEGSDWRDLDWLESEVLSYTTIDKEKRDFTWRIDRVKSSRIADYKGLRLVEPKRESGVLSLFLQLQQLEKDIFPFTIIDYDTHQGIDVIVKAKDNIPIVSSKLYYVEFKYYLDKQFNHSFENLHSIICWDIDPKNIKNGDEITDIAGVRRTLKIVERANEKDYTRFFLDDIRSDRKIEIFVLRQYLFEKCSISFRVRTEQDAL